MFKIEPQNGSSSSNEIEPRLQTRQRILVLVFALTSFGLLAYFQFASSTDDRPASDAGKKQSENSVTEKATGRKYPSVVGEMRAAPDWLKEDALFDLDRYFATIPDDENAAPLYLDAFYEFSPSSMQECIDPNEHARRGPVLVERADRAYKLWIQGELHPEEFPMASGERAQIVAEYEGSFGKLLTAQKRNRCVFQNGYDLADTAR